MRKQIKQAIEANDLPQIRALLIEAITTRAGNPDTLTEIAETITVTPGLFDPDNGRTYPAAHAMTESLIETLTEDIRTNFSLPKYRLLTEVYARIARDPAFEVMQESEESLALSSSFSSSISETISETENLYEVRKKKKNALAMIGYALLIAGVVAAIVAICIPLRFLIGVGIGVIMLGAALAYAAIPRTAPTP